MRHQSKLDLRIVGRHQHVAGSRNEGGSNLAPNCSADGNVLQIRIGRRQTSCCSPNLIEGGVYPPLRVGELWKRVEVSGLQLRELAIFEDERGYRMLFSEFFEDVLRGRNDLALAIFHRLRKKHLVEEDVTKLLRRVDVEAMAGVSVNALSEVIYFNRETIRHIAEHGGINAHSC